MSEFMHMKVDLLHMYSNNVSRHSTYRIVYFKRKLLICDALRVTTAPTTGKASYIPLSRVLAAVQSTSVNGLASTRDVASHLELQEADLQAVLIPALGAIAAKGYLAWEGECVRVL